jgi:hypothetical protein
MSTFGRTDILNNTGYDSPGDTVQARGFVKALSENGYPLIQSFYYDLNGTDIVIRVACALYDTTGAGGAPNNLLCQTNAENFGTTGWHSIDFTSNPLLPPGNYFLVVQWVKVSGTGYGSNVDSWSTAATNRVDYDSFAGTDPSVFEAHWTPGFQWSMNTKNYASVYVTYTTTPPAVAPVADFSASRVFGRKPLSVTFTDLSTETPTSWAWSFGDGHVSTEQNPTHTYTDAGNWTVSLTATNAGGSNTMTKTNYINVTEPPRPFWFATVAP